jgi:hypothetical protein
MTLSELASLGSLVSGVAVLITLVFLLIQTRQNTMALFRAEANATYTAGSEWMMAIINNQDLARLLIAGSAENGNLNEIDDLRFGNFLRLTLWFSQHIWHRQKLGILPEGEWERGTAIVTDLLVTRRGAAWWDQNKASFPPGFPEAVDKAIEASRLKIS